MRFFHKRATHDEDGLEVGPSEPAWEIEAGAVYREGFPGRSEADSDRDWPKCRLRVNSEVLRYTNSATGTSFEIPRSAIRGAGLLDGAGQPFNQKSKPKRGLCVFFDVEVDGGQTRVVFTLMGLRPGPYRHAAASLVRVARPGGPATLILPRDTTLTIESPSDVAAILSYEFYQTKFTGFEMLSLRNALTLGGQYQILGRDYPLVAEKIGEVRIGKTGGGKHCLGTMTMGGDRPLVMSLSSKDLDKSKEVSTDDVLLLNAEMGFHPKGCIDFTSVVSHEFGHAVDDYLEKLAGNPLIPLELERMFTKVRCAEISGYAKQNRREAFAEAFAAIRHMPRDDWPDGPSLLDKLLTREMGQPGAFRPLDARR